MEQHGAFSLIALQSMDIDYKWGSAKSLSALWPCPRCAFFLHFMFAQPIHKRRPDLPNQIEIQRAEKGTRVLHDHNPHSTTFMPTLTHPAELVQESLVLFREFLDSPCLLTVGFPQVNLLPLQLILQLLHVAFQFRHPSFPFSFLVLKPPPQLVLLLFQVL